MRFTYTHIYNLGASSIAEWCVYRLLLLPYLLFFCVQYTFMRSMPYLHDRKKNLKTQTIYPASVCRIHFRYIDKMWKFELGQQLTHPKAERGLWK